LFSRQTYLFRNGIINLLSRALLRGFVDVSIFDIYSRMKLVLNIKIP
jgi:hypothetical protein